MKAFSKFFDNIAVHLVGVFLFFLFSFDKGFSYLHFWVGKIPLFVTEFVLLVLVFTFMLRGFKNGAGSLIKDKNTGFLFLIFWFAGLIAVVRMVRSPEAELIHSLKKLALCYYSLFGFLVSQVFNEKKAISKILNWMFWGAALATIFTLFSRLINTLNWWPVSVGVAKGAAIAFCFFYSIFGREKEKGVWPFAIIGAIALLQMSLTGMRGSFLTFLLISVVFFYFLFSKKIGTPAFSCFKKVVLSALLLLPLYIPFVNFTGNLSRYKFVLETNQLFKDNEVDVSASDILNNDNFDEEDEHDENDRRNFLNHAWFKKLDDKVLSKSANVTWRARVWLEAIDQTISEHIWFGAGIHRPMIITAVSPYFKKSRREKAIEILKSKYSFKNRIQDPTRNPTDDVNPRLPLPLTSAEAHRYYSTYWYDLEPHNSFIGIFFRFGLVGFFSFVLIVFIVLRRLWVLIRSKDPIATLIFLSMLWYLMISALNVVLEGPFMGAVFWTLLGLGLGYSRIAMTGELTGETAINPN